VWGEASFTEGPAYGPDRCIYFSDIGNRILRFEPASGNQLGEVVPVGILSGVRARKVMQPSAGIVGDASKAKFLLWLFRGLE
jgi:hypothetical protein